MKPLRSALLLLLLTLLCWPSAILAKCKIKTSRPHNQFGLPVGVDHTAMRAIFAGGRGQFVNYIFWQVNDSHLMWVLLNKPKHFIKSKGTQDTQGPIWIEPDDPFVIYLEDGTTIRVQSPITSAQAKRKWRPLEGIDLRLRQDYVITEHDLKKLSEVPATHFRMYYSSEERIPDTTFDDTGNYFEWNVRPVHGRQLRTQAGCL